MDAKSLAKSKRAHSLHHSKKPHSSRKPTGSVSAGGGDGGKASNSPGKPVQDRERASSSALPSNWDRYGEEFDSASGEMSSKTSDVALPKSKGSDYRHLLAEAQSQPLSRGYLDSSFSLDDVLPDEFKHSLGPMLSARGEGILSWILDDNFIVDDEIGGGATATQEASFLSLNLHALAEQLAKVDISKRLFIEPDILPPDLVTCSQDSPAMSESEVSTSMPEHSAHADISEKYTKNVNKDAHPISAEPTSIATDYFKPILTESPTSAPFKPISPEPPTSKLKTFEAAAAEAELDMLLDSFGDTKLIDPSTSTSVTTFPVWQDSRMNVPSELDDMLDNLLEETSSVLNNNKPYQHTGVESSSSSQSVSKSEVLDDFGSWLDST